MAKNKKAIAKETAEMEKSDEVLTVAKTAKTEKVSKEDKKAMKQKKQKAKAKLGNRFKNLWICLQKLPIYCKLMAQKSK